MAKSLELLLVENVDTLGIVGDVVKVRTGYARNFLLPRALATKPSEEKIKDLQGKRAEAQRQLALLRKQREELSEKLKGIEIDLVRSCNDLGHLYGAVTQQDIAKALTEKGYGVKPRDVRLNQTIKRVDNFDIHVKLDSDLDALIKLHVKPDRELDLTREEPAAAPPPAEREAAPADAAAVEKPERKAKKTEGGEKADKGPRPEKAKGEKADKAAEKTEKKEFAKGEWGHKSEKAPGADKVGKISGASDSGPQKVKKGKG